MGVTQSQLSLAWCLKNPHVSAVITGASRPEQIVENCEALKLLERMSWDVMREIDEIVGEDRAGPCETGLVPSNDAV
jgi:aryl-alcohol dehydrogenase-like predicted oxidoreductase